MNSFGKFTRKDFLKLSAMVYGSFVLSKPIKGNEINKFNKSGASNSGKKVIVIGAGISGLACAKKLQEQGCEVKVLESRNRIGGRIHTYRDCGYPMDLGASWIHGVNINPIYKIANQEQLKLHETDYDSAIFYDGG
ncbi:MAG: FAD-dependent oxidoreductase, partial [Leptospira sp.]|nr:FAD-dependent oxidoreductase [Leptospira sp.]